MNTPGVEPQRPSCPVNITTMINPIGATRITVSCKIKDGHNYAIAVYLVRKLTSAQLLQRLRARGVRHSDYTRDLSKYTEFLVFWFL